MISQHIATILLVTGLITAVPVIQFLLPVAGLRLLHQLEISDEAGRLFARHWGLCTLTIGLLLVYAAGADEGARRAIVGAVLIEKLGLVVLVASSWSRPAVRGLRLSAIVDAVFSALYVLYLVHLA